jgi:ATP-dependent DNA helicase RecG
MAREGNNPLNQSVQYLKGVGPARAEALKAVGVKTVSDLLYYVPRRYLDRSEIKPIADLEPGRVVTVLGKVVSTEIRRGRRERLSVVIKDKSGFLDLVWFSGIRYFQKIFRRGLLISASGMVNLYDTLQIVHPEYEILSDEEQLDLVHTGRLVPLYPSTLDLKQARIDSRSLRRIIKSAVEIYARSLIESLPEKVLRSCRLMPLAEAISQIHFPDDLSLASKARERLAFEELFYLELMLAKSKKARQEVSAGISFSKPGNLVRSFLDRLDFVLTDSQKKVLRETFHDMSSPRPMHRLLQGDVGSGKTVVAMIVMLIAVENGYQAALMAPTEILAEQHYLSCYELLEELGVKVTLFTGSLTGRARKSLLKEVEEGEIQIVVGTHTLIQEGVEFAKLGFVTIDEQHRFGVRQRARLKQKGHFPDVLVMTATPIPRSLALTLYGDLDISVIDQMPPGRGIIFTREFGEGNRQQAYDFLKSELDKGRQAYVVFPIIEESEKLELKAAVSYYEKLKEGKLSTYRLDLLHGRMKGSEKEEIMRRFREGETQALIATPVVEVGLDVPNATVMLIEHPERFGLSQLHQLRGRIGRGGHDSFCLLVSSEKKTEEAKERIKLISSTTDGFKISEYDMQMRGPGEFFGTRQHGLPELKYADLAKDYGLVRKAREAAFKLVEQDPEFTGKDNRTVKEIFESKYKDRLRLLRAG